MKNLSIAQQRRVEYLQRQLRSSTVDESATPAQLRVRCASAAVVLTYGIQAEVDEIIAADCVLCGEYMIKSIDEPFVPEEDLDSFIRSWSFDM